jgi:hypothetical protein
MYSVAVAEQLRARGHDVVSVLDQDYDRLRGTPDDKAFAAAAAYQRVLVTENVPDFRRLEGESMASGREHPGLIYITNMQFP